ncbi:rhodanese-related sulfurtransferase [Curtobacterium sp. S6]|uniref:oxygen-dependent tRNA uridine(34) hydroxylase TrhO n=1 Tax=Curtobacterium sp. S6 TaxID=1479623 RepID=UPI0004AA5B6F|nr:rhodanese-related sulfurtransferase [Curtobacterium sp. S6]
MALSRIVLYYHFAPIADPEAVVLWQRALCEKLGLRGRILVSPHGINGTVGGEIAAVKQYARTTRQFSAFRGMEFKWSDGGAEDFPRLSVKAREEIVAFGAADELVVDEGGVVGGGTHLSPQQVNELVEKEGDDVVFFDGRNAFESRIGRFKGAVVPDTRTTHDFLKELESGKYDDLKGKKVITYCTGGIRCEILSVLMKNRGFEDVYQIDGGIVRYGEAFGDSGLWEGSLYVFDQRMHMEFTPDAVTIGRCERCQAPSNKFVNCANSRCRELILLCPDCSAAEATCPNGCQTSAQGQRAA